VLDIAAEVNYSYFDLQMMINKWPIMALWSSSLHLLPVLVLMIHQRVFGAVNLLLVAKWWLSGGCICHCTCHGQSNTLGIVSFPDINIMESMSSQVSIKIY